MAVEHIPPPRQAQIDAAAYIGRIRGISAKRAEKFVPEDSEQAEQLANAWRQLCKAEFMATAEVMDHLLDGPDRMPRQTWPQIVADAEKKIWEECAKKLRPSALDRIFGATVQRHVSSQGHPLARPPRPSPRLVK